MTVNLTDTALVQSVARHAYVADHRSRNAAVDLGHVKRQAAREAPPGAHGRVRTGRA